MLQVYLVTLFMILRFNDFRTFDITGYLIVILYITGVPNSKYFDLQLMIYLIKYLTSTYPINGSNCLPSPKETTPGCDLVRLQWYRQTLKNSDKLDSDHFTKTFSDISGVCIFLNISIYIHGNDCF